MTLFEVSHSSEKGKNLNFAAETVGKGSDQEWEMQGNKACEGRRLSHSRRDIFGWSLIHCDEPAQD